MNDRQLRWLGGLLVAALVLWGGFAFARHARRDRATALTLPKIDTAAVDTIAFHTAGDSAVLVRGPGGAGGWRVNGFPAAMASVNRMLQALNDSSNRTELAAEHAGSEASMGVSADSGHRVRVAVKGGAGWDLVAGHSTSDYSGVYVRLASDSAVYALHGPLAPSLTHAIDDWRDKTVATLPADSVQRVEVTHGRESYALVRAGKQWKLSSGAAADSDAVQRLLAGFHPLSAEGFAKPAVAASANFNRPTARVRLFGHGTAPLVDLRFDSTVANVLARADAGSTVYLLGSYMLGELAPAEKTLRASTPKPR